MCWHTGVPNLAYLSMLRTLTLLGVSVAINYTLEISPSSFISCLQWSCMFLDNEINLTHIMFKRKSKGCDHRLIEVSISLSTKDLAPLIQR